MKAPEILNRMLRAINSHDLDALVNCFADDYGCEIPVHPSRSFIGNQHVRQNWTGLFGRVPNIEARVLRSVVDGDTVWSEWEMTGRTIDGADIRFAGVVILGARDDRFAWSRFYLDPAESGSSAAPHATSASE